MILSEQERSEFGALKQRYEKPQAILLPVLWKIQQKNGWIDDAAMEEAAEVAECTKAHVMGVVTFYTMFFDKPMGRYHVQVCTNVSCMLRGGEKIYDAVKQTLGIGNMQCTSDGMFSLEEVECMGACGGAPMIAVGETFFEKMNSDEALGIIQQIKASGQVPVPKELVQLPDLAVEAK